LKHPEIPEEVTLNRNNPRQNSVCFATLLQLKTLYISYEKIHISFQSRKARFETACVSFSAYYLLDSYSFREAHGSAVGRSTTLHVGKKRVRVQMK
jgi:hypothetical protein